MITEFLLGFIAYCSFVTAYNCYKSNKYKENKPIKEEVKELSREIERIVYCLRLEKEGSYSVFDEVGEYIYRYEDIELIKDYLKIEKKVYLDDMERKVYRYEKIVDKK